MSPGSPQPHHRADSDNQTTEIYILYLALTSGRTGGSTDILELLEPLGLGTTDIGLGE